MHQTAPPAGHAIRPPASLLGRLVFLAMLGFMVVLMIGPLVAVLSAIISVILSIAVVVLSIAVALLPLALIGLVVWGIFQAFAPGHESSRLAFKLRLKEFGRTFGRFTGATCRHAYRAIGWTAVRGGSCLAWAGRGVQSSMQAIRQAAAGRGRVVGRLLLEMFCGAALATGVCLAASDGAPEAIPIGILGGAILGGAIGWSKPVPRQETIRV